MYRRVKTIALHALITGVLYSQVAGQEVAPGYAVERWTIQNGLPVNHIYEIIKTLDGYMWLGNPEGLTRFDGLSFKTFNSSNTEVLLRSRVTEFTRSQNNEFWFNNHFGDSLRLIQYKDGVFNHHPFNHKPIPVHNNRRFDVSDNGELWVAGEQALFKFDGKQFIPKFEDEIHSDLLHIFIAETAIWVSALDGFYRIKDNDISFIEFTNTRQSTFIVERDETIWITTGESLIRLNKEEAQRFSLPNELLEIGDPSLKLNKSFPDELFVSNAITKFVFKEDKFVKVFGRESYSETGIEIATKLSEVYSSGWFTSASSIFHQNNRVAALDLNLAFPLFIDEHQQAWLGTKKGLYRFSKSLFNTYPNNPDLRNIYPLFEDHKGAIWTSTLRGSVFRILDDDIERITDDDFPRVFSFYEDPAKNIWMGTGHGIQLWNRTSGSLSSIPTPFDRQAVQVKVLQENDREILWVGSKAGLYEYNLITEDWTKISAEGNKGLQIEQLIQHENGDVWIGTRRNGLYTLKNNVLVSFRGNEQISDVGIRSMYMDDEGLLWVGLNGGGLNRIELAKDRVSANSVTKYSRENGLLGSIIHSIMEDDYGRIWMSSNQGIFWVSKQQLNDVASGKINRIYPTKYQKQDGLPGNEANGGAQSPGLIARNGTMWFAMMGGLAHIHPSDVKNSSFSFPTVIESVEANDSVWASFNEDINIPKEYRNIKVKYTAFNYATKINDLHFSYRLEGLNDDWVPVGTDREVSFPNLSPGSYTFYIKAGASNLWDEDQISSVTFTIEPYYYETAWFFGLLFLASSSLFSGLVFTWKSLKRRAEKQQPYIAKEEINTETNSSYDPFLDTLQKYIEEHIEKPSITVAELASLMNMGERNLHRKIKKATGYTPHQFVREIRLKKAREILGAGQVSTISEVAHSVGFSTPFYFSKLFEERFNIHPGESIK